MWKSKETILTCNLVQPQNMYSSLFPRWLWPYASTVIVNIRCYQNMGPDYVTAVRLNIPETWKQKKIRIWSFDAESTHAFCHYIGESWIFLVSFHWPERVETKFGESLWLGLNFPSKTSDFRLSFMGLEPSFTFVTTNLRSDLIFPEETSKKF